MSMTYPTISVIIPRKSDDTADDAIHAILSCDYPQELVEILEVVGETGVADQPNGIDQRRLCELIRQVFHNGFA